MSNLDTSSLATATIAAMVTPAILILACTSLAASALVRMARVVDRVRVLAAMVQQGNWQSTGTTAAELHKTLERHRQRAHLAAWSIAAFYAGVVIFVITCLSIVADRALAGSLAWLPLALAIAGTLLLLAGGALMVAESRLSGEQIAEEINRAVLQLKEQP
jgi:hypothetical protein